MNLPALHLQILGNSDSRVCCRSLWLLLRQGQLRDGAGILLGTGGESWG